MNGDNIFDAEESISPVKRKKVFVVNVSNHDLSDAERFGELIPITVGATNPFQSDELTAMVAKVIAKSTTDDYLLLSGHRPLNSIASILWIFKNQHLKILIFNSKRRQYVQRDLSLRHMQELMARAVDSLKETT